MKDFRVERELPPIVYLEHQGVKLDFPDPVATVLLSVQPALSTRTTIWSLILRCGLREVQTSERVLLRTEREV